MSRRKNRRSSGKRVARDPVHPFPIIKEEGARGHAIFIHGIPSSGKSSVAKRITGRTSTFRVLAGDELVREVPFEQRAAQAERIFGRTLDLIDRRLKSTNLIVDGAWTEAQVVEAQNRFGHNGLYVILRISESERRRREANRRDRRLAYWHPSWHDMPGPDSLYDLVIDSEVASVSECASRILTKAGELWTDLRL